MRKRFVEKVHFPTDAGTSGIETTIRMSTSMDRRWDLCQPLLTLSNGPRKSREIPEKEVQIHFRTACTMRAAHDLFLDDESICNVYLDVASTTSMDFLIQITVEDTLNHNGWTHFWSVDPLSTAIVKRFGPYMAFMDQTTVGGTLTKRSVP